MKQNLAFIAIAIGILTACNNADTGTTNTDTASTTTGDTSAMGTNATVGTGAPLTGADSQFVIDAAHADMMEIESANIAQQNASSQRVKDYAAMMLRDHTNSSNELKSFVSGRNVTLPDSLPKKDRQHLESMRKMQGKTFDNHYMQMMNQDHSKVVTKFKNASTNLADAQLKSWAAQKLPTLQMHLDSAKAINRKSQ